MVATLCVLAMLISTDLTCVLFPVQRDGDSWRQPGIDKHYADPIRPARQGCPVQAILLQCPNGPSDDWVRSDLQFHREVSLKQLFQGTASLTFIKVLFSMSL